MSENMNDMWFLITTSEGSFDYEPHKSYEDAVNAMKKDYSDYEFDVTAYDEGVCYIDDNSAYIDSPGDGWQRHWSIVSVAELKKIWANKMTNK